MFPHSELCKILSLPGRHYPPSEYRDEKTCLHLIKYQEPFFLVAKIPSLLRKYRGTLLLLLLSGKINSLRLSKYKVSPHLEAVSNSLISTDCDLTKW